ncbi:hypothetical protein [Solitalea canadensis]|uniref:Uncharacterized protein n=1 Tax=Solitalea canadensis (strain ATCC 29591 / DSM 3403 / JCM 21819 / LMG 8368 / NBRC 15130 / NCIMB 12057 / USAM 9D) TaxID=929556 RepID=H8KPW1_SOLCM|nr:hypothetical protein [Solitalea canadensis]AFD06070.1 hypothetical protein Solca_0958 [Solitalea canadensis DSM 3403]
MNIIIRKLFRPALMMKNASLTLFFLFILTSAIAQSVDSLNEKRFEYLNKCFDNFPPNKTIDSLDQTYGLQLCSLTECLLLLELSNMDKSINDNVLLRLKELANKNFENRSFILLVEGSMNSVKKTIKLTEESGLVYVSLGNSCLGSREQEKGIAIFNKQMMFLINKKGHK